MRIPVAATLTLAVAMHVGALDLTIGPDDVRIEQYGDGGYHLYVRAKPDVRCVLLTESTKDPAFKADTFAYRAKTRNAINGDEKRMLNGAFLSPEKKLYSLISSTPVSDTVYGTAFHIFIPYVVEYGYEWSRHGEVFLTDGTFINIRAFPLPYGDYAKGFVDNPFLMRLTQVPIAAPRPVVEIPAPKPDVPPTETPTETPKAANKQTDEPIGNYDQDAVDAFKKLAEAGKGVALYSKGPSDIADRLAEILDRAKGKSLDLVVCIDTTDSMKDDIDMVKATLPDMIRKRLADYPTFRLGAVFYKDYFEEYVVKRFEFTSDASVFGSWIQSIRVNGGRDIPEAVYEALYEGLSAFPWTAQAKIIVLIGDAPPHPIPRGRIDKAMVHSGAAAQSIELDMIILPH